MPLSALSKLFSFFKPQVHEEEADEAGETGGPSRMELMELSDQLDELNPTYDAGGSRYGDAQATSLPSQPTPSRMVTPAELQKLFSHPDVGDVEEATDIKPIGPNLHEEKTPPPLTSDETNDLSLPMVPSPSYTNQPGEKTGANNQKVAEDIQKPPHLNLSTLLNKGKGLKSIDPNLFKEGLSVELTKGKHPIIERMLRGILGDDFDKHVKVVEDPDHQDALEVLARHRERAKSEKERKGNAIAAGKRDDENIPLKTVPDLPRRGRKSSLKAWRREAKVQELARREKKNYARDQKIKEKRKRIRAVV